MFEPADLDRLIEAMCANGVTTLEIKRGKRCLRLSYPPSLHSAPARNGPASGHELAARSPGIGTFLPRGEDDGLPGLEPGAIVQKAEVLGYICQHPVRVVIAAPLAGVLKGEAPHAGALLGYGDTVFTVEVRQ